ncbi:MAG TPA: 3-deoxy-7-phosphoheptulonate synthase [Pyrinomonadaceae bacterium]|nr:3-deoxy-7-phosphoheptulonate synthase [Pyrinomonadaceae bacterium]
MLIVMKVDATDGQIKAVTRVIEELGFTAHAIQGAGRTAIAITGNQSSVDPGRFENMPGVSEAVRITKPYKLVTQGPGIEKTVVRVGDAVIGGEVLTIIAGPCAVESRTQALTIAEVVRRSGAQFFRGGAFKPRTSPYAFQGLGEDGLKILADVRDEHGLKIVTEALDEPGVDLVERYADVIQIGARSMQNFTLLRRVGKSGLPVLLKRGLSATLDEWLLAAEYIMSEGNSQVVLCERGIRTFSQHTRNTLDLAAVPAVRRVSHLPVIVDPSHGTGKNYMVTPLARAGVAVGADGLIVEVHDRPEQALSDGAQALTLDQYEELVIEVRAIHEVMTPAAVR